MRSTSPFDESTRLSIRVQPDIDTAAARIAEEVDRRFANPDHPLHGCQVVVSEDRRYIWIVTAYGPCLDERYTLVHIHPTCAWTGGCSDYEEGPTTGWQVSTPSEIVDLVGEA